MAAALADAGAAVLVDCRDSQGFDGYEAARAIRRAEQDRRETGQAEDAIHAPGLDFYDRLVDELVAKKWDFLSASRFPLTDPKAMNVTNRPSAEIPLGQE